MKSHAYTRSQASGQALVLFVLGLVVLLGFVALAIDGSRIYMEHVHAQSVADAAALSGALAKCRNQDVSNAATSIAASNGFNNDNLNDTVTVANPPSSGSHAGDSDYVQVSITANIEASFAQLIYNGPLQTTVQALAHCNPNSAGGPASGYALIVLNETAQQTLSGTGSAQVNVIGGGVYVNSNSSKAAVLTGGASVSADGIKIVGNYSISGSGTFDPTPVTGVSPIADPLADVPTPPKPAGPCTTISGSTTLEEGLYCKIQLSGGAQVRLNPGIYGSKAVISPVQVEAVL